MKQCKKGITDFHTNLSVQITENGSPRRYITTEKIKKKIYFFFHRNALQAWAKELLREKVTEFQQATRRPDARKVLPKGIFNVEQL